MRRIKSTRSSYFCMLRIVQMSHKIKHGFKSRDVAGGGTWEPGEQRPPLSKDEISDYDLIWKSLKMNEERSWRWESKQ